MEIQSVVFDYGSVLAWPPSSENCHRVAATAGISVDVLLDRYYRDRSAYDRGTIDDIEYWRAVTKGYPASEDTTLLRKLADLDVEIWSDPNEATIGWLPALKQHGVLLAILSNMPASACDAYEMRDRWLDIFDYRIFSGRVGINKPEPAIFQLLLDTLAKKLPGIAPHNVLFLDDLAHNVTGARQAGINAEVYNAFDGGLKAIAKRYNLPEPQENAPAKERLGDTACAPHRQGR